jgi:2-polyprenyl-6-methoxyphenol hydroxylase-like FAD-dependent oxidoreductase
MRVMIVGSGIGGLTATIALRRAGLETAVFERTGDRQEAGAGLLLAANATRALDALGLSEETRRLGTSASAAEIRSCRGEVLSAIPASKLEERLGVRSTAVHRGPPTALAARCGRGERTLRLGVRRVCAR